MEASTLSIGQRTPRLLVVDDEPSVLDLLRRRLEALGCDVLTLPGGSRVADTAREHQPDLILLDVMMPDLDGFSVLQRLKEDQHVRDIPVLLLTARLEVESRIKGLELGAHDYVPKPFETSELVARVRAALRTKYLQDELRDANRLLERMATSDALTGLPNRRTFDEQFFVEVERARRTRQVLSLIITDLDRFKEINDAYGHQAGDEALRRVASIYTMRPRKTDLVARYGGEEFVWVLPGASPEGATEVAEWLRRTLEDTVIVAESGEFTLSVSSGVSSYDPATHGPVSATTLLEAADAALREAKAAGRNRVAYRPLGLEEAEEAPEESPGSTRYR